MSDWSENGYENGGYGSEHTSVTTTSLTRGRSGKRSHNGQTNGRTSDKQRLDRNAREQRRSSKIAEQIETLRALLAEGALCIHTVHTYMCIVTILWLCEQYSMQAVETYHYHSPLSQACVCEKLAAFTTMCMRSVQVREAQPCSVRVTGSTVSTPAHLAYKFYAACSHEKHVQLVTRTNCRSCLIAHHAMHDDSGGICVKGSKQELLSGVADYMRQLQRMLSQQQHQMQTQRQTSGSASCEEQVQLHEHDQLQVNEHDRLPPPPCPPAVKAVKLSSSSSMKQPSTGVTAPVITVDSAYREVFLQSAVALAVADASGRFIEVSARFEGTGFFI
jgi:Helix-loop-helix DNA-binding domain